MGLDGDDGAVEGRLDGVPWQMTLVNGRWPLRLPLHRAVRPEWPWWEAQRLAAMSLVVGPESVVYDVGAEEGDFPALWASWGARVVLAEPNPKVWPNILAVWRLNGLRDPLGMWEGMVGTKDEPGDVLGWPASAHGAVIGDHGFIQYGQGDKRPEVTLDTLARRVGTPPTVITMDVEGAETFVLAGAAGTLAEHRPHVFVSIHDQFARDHYGIADCTAEVRRFMESQGYYHRYLGTDHEAHWWFLPPGPEAQRWGFR